MDAPKISNPKAASPSPGFALFRLHSGRETEVGHFATVKDAAAYLYNTESDRDECIANAWESGAFGDCIRGDFHIRAIDLFNLLRPNTMGC